MRRDYVRSRPRLVVMYLTTYIAFVVNVALGGEAEAWTSSRFRRLRREGWMVIDRGEFDHEDVDHVAVGPDGVFAVETKYTS